MSFFSNLPEVGAAVANRAVTATLYVSPEGGSTDGLTWAGAFNTIQDALDAASTDGDECTQIVVSPHTTFYDIDITGDPTWTGNYDIIGAHRIWSPIRNNHADATSVLNFSGKVSIRDLAIFTDGTLAGVCFTGNGWRVRQCGFNSVGLTAAATSVHLNGSAAVTRGGIMEDVQFLGNVAYTTAIHNEQSTINEFGHIHIHDCLVGVLIDGTLSDKNYFHDGDIGDSALGFDIDAGAEQHFEHIDFHHNTRNVDDEVGDHHYVEMHGELDISVSPDDLVGVAVLTGAANTYGTDNELIAAASADNPFRITGYSFGPATSEWYQVGFASDGAGTTFFDVVQFDATKQIGNAAGAGTEHIFNAATRISAKARDVSGADLCAVWVNIQEI